MLKVNENGVLKTVSQAHRYLWTVASGGVSEQAPGTGVMAGISAPCEIITFFIVPYTSNYIFALNCRLDFKGSTVESGFSPMGQGGWIYARMTASSSGSGTLSYYKTAGSMVCGAISLIFRNTP